MRIAVLGWGSLCWDPRELELSGDWQGDGPLLPIEFARISKGKRVTLVLHEGAPPVRSLWAMSARDSLEEAIADLAAREESSEIGSARQDQPGEVPEPIREWLESHPALDAVIWTNLRSNFQAESGIGALNGPNLVKYLDGLRATGNAGRAEEYVRKAPAQVRTEYRAWIESAFGWSSSISTDDIQFEEWKECRATIGRMDGYLEDLRKFGFSLVTGLLTAGAIAGGAISNNQLILPLSGIAVMVLVLALFGVDQYYQVLLSGTVERAMDLERMTDPWIRVTKVVGRIAVQSRASMTTFALYVALLLTAFGLGWVGPSATGKFAVTGVGVVALICMASYWVYIRQQTKLHIEKKRYWPEDPV